MSFERFGMWMGLRPQVMHRLPGRLRLRIPALKRLPVNPQGVGEIVGTLIELLPGVHSVDTNVVTGSVLVRYDPNKLGEKAIMNHINGLIRMTQKNPFSMIEHARRDFPALIEWARAELLGEHLDMKSDSQTGDAP